MLKSRVRISASLTGKARIIFEPKLIRKNSTRMESVIMFREAMLENYKKGFPKQGHQIYLEQWGHNK